jgi:SAM-dependent methyltransferase
MVARPEGEEKRMPSVEEKQKTEIDYWRSSETESPESDSVENIINKVSESAVFLDCLQRFKKELPGEGVVLELGAGQGWASCLYKRLYPLCRLITTDISPYAVASLSKWEELWKVKVDGFYACKSYETREADASVDAVFCFASAHHFLEHRKTLVEILRILKPGSRCFYFYEPACPRFWYGPAYWRVNRKRPDVPEDVLVVSRIRDLAQKVGLQVTVDYYPCLIRRGPLEMVYYYLLARVPLLKRLFPCTVNFIFQKIK